MTFIILLLNLVTTVLSETSTSPGSVIIDTATSLDPLSPVSDVSEYGCACNDNSTSYLRHKATVMQVMLQYSFAGTRYCQVLRVILYVDIIMCYVLNRYVPILIFTYGRL